MTLTEQEIARSNIDKLRSASPSVASAFRSLREAADAVGPLEPKHRELTLLAGFAVTRNESGFRAHCKRATSAGASLEEIQQTVILLLGTSIGLVPVVEALDWALDEHQSAEQ
jgi:alkylhydroperoxidase/carboxymuconolactone decarboxylase family protein YurZ